MRESTLARNNAFTNEPAPKPRIDPNELFRGVVITEADLGFRGRRFMGWWRFENPNRLLPGVLVVKDEGPVFKPDPKPRRCLAPDCGQMFPSSWAGDRICPTCRQRRDE